MALLNGSSTSQFRVTLYPSQFSNYNGAYRMPYGSDYISFYGSAAAESRRPYLTLYVHGTGVPAQPPVSSNTAPASVPGTVIASNASSFTVTCDGGPDGVFQGGWVVVLGMR